MRILVTITERGSSARDEQFEQNEITIGRVQGNDIVLPRGNISKRHTRVVLRDGHLIAVDLKSSNGTFVNGKRISSPQVLKESDRIYIGDFTLSVRLGHGVAARAIPPPPPPPPPPPRAVPMSGGSKSDRAIALRVAYALKDPRVKVVLLREGAAVECNVALDDIAGIPVSALAIVGLLRAHGVALHQARPLFDGASPMDGNWRITAQGLDGAPFKARFRRVEMLSLDDDIDPLPPD